MSSSTILLVLLTLALILRTSFGAEPLQHFCSNSETFTAQYPYASNLKTLITTLIAYTPPTGFGLSITPDPNQNQTAFGLALCRGDTSASECKACLSEATKELLSFCPHHKGGIIWYDYCMFKYNNTAFFGKIDNKNGFIRSTLKSVSDPETFNRKTKQLLSMLAQRAYGNSKFYASGKLELQKPETLYGLIQCSRDLSSIDCKECLQEAINRFPVHVSRVVVGGGIVGGSCNFRYELYPFFNIN
ncbi:hypothetical protein RJT34_28825 [Clitoria ternatea]|uniref:Gnk2-homologous domain-containing protein n=1 Tax=Clitoria ternatea TaxID=43366 RepID=A0AAN9FI52_CLITE